MIMKYKFKDLTQKAQERAVKDYIKGWEETHDKGDMSVEEAFEILRDLNERYSKFGRLIEESHEE